VGDRVGSSIRAIRVGDRVGKPRTPDDAGLPSPDTMQVNAITVDGQARPCAVMSRATCGPEPVREPSRQMPDDPPLLQAPQPGWRQKSPCYSLSREAMRFWKSKPKTSATNVAVDVLRLAQGQKASESPLLAQAGVNLAAAEQELFHLRIFAVEYGIVAALKGSTLEKVLGAHLAHLKLVSSQMGSDGETFVREMLRRRDAYWQAVKTPHPQGPPWQIGKVFSDLCGGGMDPNVVMTGSLEFTGTVKAVSKFLNDVTIE
jgi:hypothetical protein